MKKWWQRKKSNTKRSDNYSLVDLLLDVLFWIPELILFPFRVMYWMLRGLGRFIGEVF